MKTFYTSRKSPQEITACLTDMEKYVTVHPVITRIEETANGKLKIYERLRIFGIPFNFSYPALILADAEGKHIMMRCIVGKMIDVEIIFIIREYKGGSIIEEEINFWSHLPVKTILRRIFKKQHARLFSNIERQSH